MQASRRDFDCHCQTTTCSAAPSRSRTRTATPGSSAACSHWPRPRGSTTQRRQGAPSPAFRGRVDGVVSRPWRPPRTRREDALDRVAPRRQEPRENASTLKKDGRRAADRRARACPRTARPRGAARRGPLCEYDCRGDGVFMGSSKTHARPRDQAAALGSLGNRNAAAEKRRDAGSRRGDGQGSSGTSGTVRGDDVRRVRTERTEPAPRSATRDGPDATCVDGKTHAVDATPHPTPDATESASSSSSSTGSAEGAAAGATASSRSRAARACRSRNSTPAPSSAASAAHARFAQRGSASSAPAP